MPVNPALPLAAPIELLIEAGWPPGGRSNESVTVIRSDSPSRLAAGIADVFRNENPVEIEEVGLLVPLLLDETTLIWPKFRS